MRSLAAFRSILLPTDFSDEAMVAFAHGLRLAVALKAELEILHVEPKNDQPDWRWGPRVLETLVRWGFLTANATEDDVARLGIRYRKVVSVGEKAEQAIVEEIVTSHADLVVMAAHGRSGVRRWLEPSVSAPVALRGAVPVLVIPHNKRGFVNVDTGETSLTRILIPVAEKPHPAPAFDGAALIAGALPAEVIYFASLHVGAGVVETDWLEPNPTWKTLSWNVDGGVVESVEDTARTWSADLIACVTEGRHGLLDALRGSTAERLLEHTPTAFLVVPHEWGTDQVGTENRV